MLNPTTPNPTVFFVSNDTGFATKVPFSPGTTIGEFLASHCRSLTSFDNYRITHNHEKIVPRDQALSEGDRVSFVLASSPVPESQRPERVLQDGDSLFLTPNKVDNGSPANGSY